MASWANSGSSSYQSAARPGKRLGEDAPPSITEESHWLWYFRVYLSVICEKPLGLELHGIREDVWVVHESPRVPEHDSPFGNEVPVVDVVLGHAMGESCRSVVSYLATGI